jgi:hypothetical protein
VPLRHDYNKKSIFPEENKKNKFCRMSFENIEEGVGKPENVRENTTPSWVAVI